MQSVPGQGTSHGEVPPVLPVLTRCRKVDKSLGPDLELPGVSALVGCFPLTAAGTPGRIIAMRGRTKRKRKFYKQLVMTLLPHKRVEEEAL